MPFIDFVLGSSGRGPLRFHDPRVSASLIMACGILQNFIVDEREEAENDDDCLLEEYAKDVRKAADGKRRIFYEDDNLELSDDEDIPSIQEIDEAKNRLKKQFELFISFNNL